MQKQSPIINQKREEILAIKERDKKLKPKQSALIYPTVKMVTINSKGSLYYLYMEET
jgi:hypothetical protein